MEPDQHVGACRGEPVSLVSGRPESVSNVQVLPEPVSANRPRGTTIARTLGETQDWPDISGAASSTAEIEVVDLFAGCGGLSTGFAAIGAISGSMRVAGAVEIDSSAAATYEANLGVRPLITDLAKAASSTFESQDLVRRLGVDTRAPLVVVGGPPCQGFTSHTKRNKNDQDQRNSLVHSFAILAAHMDADVIVMENVPELLSAKHWHHFLAFKSHLEERGYTVTAEIHNLATFGVPQERFRATILATKGHAQPMPRPTHARHEFRSVREAIGGLRPINPGEVDTLDPQHFSANHRPSTIEVIRQIPLDGGSRPKGVGPVSLDKVDGFRDVYGRLSWDRPANTITRFARNPASGRYVHPQQHRGLTIREAALLQGFPKSFDFKGSFDSRFSQIGNAVPPLYAAHIAGTVLDYLRGDAPVDTEATDDDFLRIVNPTRDSFSSGLISLKAKSNARGNS